MAVNQTPAALSLGTLVKDRFRVKKLLGFGGYGNVYLVEDEIVFPGNQFALKESLSSTVSEQRQFTREAKWLMTLEHPNLPRVAEQFEWNGRAYFVMAYVAGENLEDRVDRLGPLPEEQVLAWILPICHAVNYLHGQKRPIIHRDIKPANIIVSKDGRPWLVDFGIAKVLQTGTSRKTTRAARAVSGGYSPLEQYTRGGTDVRSDVYALGATLYHLLTGICPPEAPDIVSGVARLPDARQVHSRISRQTDQVVMQAMRQKPEERYQSVREMMADLPGGRTFSITANGTAASSKRGPKRARGAPASSLPATPQPGDAAAQSTAFVPAQMTPAAMTPAGTVISPPANVPPPSWAAAQPAAAANPTAQAAKQAVPRTEAFALPPLPPTKLPAPRRRVMLAGVVALLCGLAVVATMVLTALYLLGVERWPIFVPGYKDIVTQDDWRLAALLVLMPVAALLLLVFPIIHWAKVIGRGLTYTLLLLVPLLGIAPVIVWMSAGHANVIDGLFGSGFFLPALLFLVTWGTSLAQVIRRR